MALVAVLYGLRQVRPRDQEALACDGLRVCHLSLLSSAGAGGGAAVLACKPLLCVPSLPQLAGVMGWAWLVKTYVVPYMIVNFWLVFITLLQHTHPGKLQNS